MKKQKRTRTAITIYLVVEHSVGRGRQKTRDIIEAYIDGLLDTGALQDFIYDPSSLDVEVESCSASVSVAEEGREP